MLNVSFCDGGGVSTGLHLQQKDQDKQNHMAIGHCFPLNFQVLWLTPLL